MSARQQTSAHCHPLIKQTAIELAGTAYDELMKDDLLFTAWKKKFPSLTGTRLENVFLKKYWGDFVPGARATLARMLVYPLDESLKESIVEALCLDQTLVRGRKSPAQVIGHR